MVYLKYWTLNFRPLMVYPKVLFPPKYQRRHRPRLRPPRAAAALCQGPTGAPGPVPEQIFLCIYVLITLRYLYGLRQVRLSVQNHYAFERQSRNADLQMTADSCGQRRPSIDAIRQECSLLGWLRLLSNKKACSACYLSAGISIRARSMYYLCSPETRVLES